MQVYYPQNYPENCGENIVCNERKSSYYTERIRLLEGYIMMMNNEHEDALNVICEHRNSLRTGTQ